jgi:hypothetical protein
MLKEISSSSPYHGQQSLFPHSLAIGACAVAASAAQMGVQIASGATLSSEYKVGYLYLIIPLRGE